MDNLKHKLLNAKRRARRVRSTVTGSGQRPRLAVHISNMHVTAQIIDDQQHKTLAYATTIGSKAEGTMIEKATWVGEAIAKKAKTVKVSKVVLDRASHKYHGRVKALAEAARQAGLEF